MADKISRAKFRSSSEASQKLKVSTKLKIGKTLLNTHYDWEVSKDESSRNLVLELVLRGNANVATNAFFFYISWIDPSCLGKRNMIHCQVMFKTEIEKKMCAELLPCLLFDLRFVQFKCFC